MNSIASLTIRKEAALRDADMTWAHRFATGPVRLRPEPQSTLCLGHLVTVPCAAASPFERNPEYENWLASRESEEVE